MDMTRRLVLAAVVVAVAAGLLGCGSGPAEDAKGMDSASQDALYVVSAPPDGLLVCRVAEMDAATGKLRQSKLHSCKRLLFLPGFVVFEDKYSHGLPEGRSTALATGAIHSLRWEVSDVRIETEPKTRE